MKNYKITTQEVGGYPIKNYEDEKLSLVKAENSEGLIKKMGWDKVDKSNKRYEWSCKVLNGCIENEGSCFFRHDEEYFDYELYMWDGENTDGTKIEVEVVSDEEALDILKEIGEVNQKSDIIRNQELDRNSSDWDQFFMGKMPNEIMEELKNYKFPELI